MRRCRWDAGGGVRDKEPFAAAASAKGVEAPLRTRSGGLSARADPSATRAALSSSPSLPSSPVASLPPLPWGRAGDRETAALGCLELATET